MASKEKSSKKLTSGGDDGDGEVKIFLLHLFNLSSFAVSRLGFRFDAQWSNGESSRMAFGCPELEFSLFDDGFRKVNICNVRSFGFHVASCVF
ncbi:unnamed protein product [Lathyrus oleraceus]